jgi:regulation of enolase protein 1 (concanavalin A-like superfamily)
MLCFSLNIKTVKAQQSFSDDFTSATLNNNWAFTDPSGGSTVDLTANSGFLRITTTSPPYRDLYKPVNTNAPKVLTSTNGNFTIETKIITTTDQEWESAGILIWKDSNNFLRLDRAVGASNSQRIVFIMSKDGGWDPIDVVLSSNLNPTFLKIARAGNVFSAYYSSEGSDWIKVRDKSFPVGDSIDVGLDVVNVYHDGTFYADFDYFRLTSTDQPPKPTPTIDISSKSSTSFSGFKVQINGNLAFNSTPLSNEPILLSYSVTGGKSWQDLTLTYTGSDGSYSAEWRPSVTGNYLVKALFEGNDIYLETSVIENLAVTSYAEENVFSVGTNSTISNLFFNSTSKALSFSVTGPSNTSGYANVYIAKGLIQDVSGVRIYLDGIKLDYSAISTEDSWLLHFIYNHSTHEVTVDLASSTQLGGIQLDNWVIYIVIAVVVIAIVGVIIALKRKKTK